MKSKVILFCVVLFCSNIVDSTPHSHDVVRDRVDPLSNWQVNQNAQNDKYPDADFTKTRNVNKLTHSANQQENDQDYYSKQEGYNYDHYGYNKGSASSQSEKEMLFNYDSPADGHRLDYNSPRVESPPPRTSHLRFANQQYRNQNWQPHNKYTNSAPRTVVIPDHDKLVPSILESNQDSDQFRQLKYVPPLNRRPNRSYLPMQYQFPLEENSGENTFAANSAHRYGSNGPRPYKSHSGGRAVGPEIKTRPLWSGQHFNKFVHAVDVTDNFREQYDNKYVGRTERTVRSDLSNTAQNSNYDSGLPVKSQPDTYSLNSERSNGLKHYENDSEDQAGAFKSTVRHEGRRNVLSVGSQPGRIYNDAPAIDITKTENESYTSGSDLKYDDDSSVKPLSVNYNLDPRPKNLAPAHIEQESSFDNYKLPSDEPLAHGHANNYRSGSRWSHVARDSYNGAFTDIPVTGHEKAQKYYEENYKSEDGSKYPVPSVPTDTEFVNYGNNEFEGSHVPKYGSSIPTSLNINPNQNMYHPLRSGIREFSINSLLSDPKIQDILANTEKRYLVIHSNGTIEHLDTIDLEKHQNSQLHLVHTKRKPIDDLSGDVALATQSPDNVPTNIAKTKYSLPTNSQPEEYKNPTPLPSHVTPPEYEDKLKPLPTNVKQSADAYEWNTFPSFKDLPEDRSHLKPLLPHAKKINHSHGTKSLPLPVNPPTYDGNSQHFSQVVNQPADNNLKALDQSADNEDSKSLRALVMRPPSNNKSKPLPDDVNETKDETNLTLLSSYAKSTDDKKSKHLYFKQSGEEDSSTLTSVQDQLGDSNDSKYHKSETTDVNQTADKNTSKPSPLDAIQLRHDTNSKLSVRNQPGTNDFNPSVHLNKRKLIRHYKSESSHVNRLADSSDSNSSCSDENQPEKDKNLIPSRLNESQSSYNSKRTPPVASKDDVQSTSTTLSQIVHDNAASPKQHVKKEQNWKHSHGKSTSNSQVETSAPYPDNSSEDQLITISPIELLTDNVSNVAPVTTTTTTTRPIKTPGKPETTKGANNKKDDAPDTIRPKSRDSTTTVSPKVHPENDKNKLRPNKSQPTDGSNSKRTHLDASTDDDQSTSTTLSQIVHDNAASPKQHVKKEQNWKHSHGKSTSNSQVKTSTPYPDYSSEDHIELVTDNVSNVASVATTTTTTRPVKTPGKPDATKGANNKKDDAPDTIRPKSRDSTTTVSPKVQPENDKNKLRPNKSQPTDGSNSKRTHLDASKDDDQSTSSTLSQIGHDNAASPKQHVKKEQNWKHSHGKSTSNSQVETSTSYPDNNSEDELITISPIELLTDNVSKVASVTTTTTTTRPVKTPGKPDATKGANNKKNYASDTIRPKSRDSTTTVSPKVQPENDKNKLRPNKSQPTDGSNSKRTHLDASKDDDQSTSSTLSQIGHDNAASPKQHVKKEQNWKHSHGKSTSNSQVETSTSYPDNNSEDELITISPIELLTDNVSKVASVTTTTTTTRPVKTPGKPDATKGANNKKNYASDTIRPKSRDSTTTVSPKVQPENDKNKLRPNKSQPTDGSNSKRTHLDASKDDDQSTSSTLSQIGHDNAASPKQHVKKEQNWKHSHGKSTSNSQVETSTPYPDYSSEDDIELVTDNVINVAPVATTTTTTRPIKPPGKSDTIKYTNNIKDNGQVNASLKSGHSTTTASPSSSTLVTDNISDDKTIQTEEYKNTQTNHVVSQVNNRDNGSRTAVYNSNELLDTNTDVPAESDDYSPGTASPSLQNDVNTGDASGENSLELEQSETEVLMTVSSSPDNDSEDDIITLNIEVSETTDNEDWASDDKTLVISIDTKNDSNDDFETSKTEGCSEDHNNSDGQGKNVEIDMANLKGEPTMWIRTTNQDFIDKLTDKSDTEFDVIYFFQMNNEPVIEREKETTKYCNGTVVIETKETTYAHKDDPTPTVVKTTQTMHLDDYEIFSFNK